MGGHRCRGRACGRWVVTRRSRPSAGREAGGRAETEEDNLPAERPSADERERDGRKLVVFFGIVMVTIALAMFLVARNQSPPDTARDEHGLGVQIGVTGMA